MCLSYHKWFISKKRGQMLLWTREIVWRSKFMYVLIVLYVLKRYVYYCLLSTMNSWWNKFSFQLMIYTETMYSNRKQIEWLSSKNNLISNFSHISKFCYTIKRKENPGYVHDVPATILHLLGLNHERLTYVITAGTCAWQMCSER